MKVIPEKLLWGLNEICKSPNNNETCPFFIEADLNLTRKEIEISLFSIILCSIFPGKQKDKDGCFSS